MSAPTNTLCSLFAAAAIALGSAGIAHAAGDDDSSGTTTTAQPQKCKDGQVWDPEARRLFGKGKCVDAAEVTKSGSQKQSMIYDYGKWLAKQGEYDDAIKVLYTVADGNDPRVLNYLGYSHRKLGRMDEALGYYKAAIAQDPDFSLVREYLGEAYIQLGMLEAARGQLTEIERICGGKACAEYGMLASLIVDSQTVN